MPKPNLDHPSLARLKARFAAAGLVAPEVRGDTTVVAPKERVHEVLAFLRDDPGCAFDFLSVVAGVDYLKYPSPPGAPGGRFAVVYNLVSTRDNGRRRVKA